MKKLLVLAMLLSSIGAYAALPPTVESMRRIKAITESKEVIDAFGSTQWITSIQGNADGSHTVLSEKCALRVEVVAIQSNPPKFVPPLEVNVWRMTCKP